MSQGINTECVLWAHICPVQQCGTFYMIIKWLYVDSVILCNWGQSFIHKSLKGNKKSSLPHIECLNKYWGLETALLCILTTHVEKQFEVVASDS